MQSGMLTNKVSGIARKTSHHKKVCLASYRKTCRLGFCETVPHDLPPSTMVKLMRHSEFQYNDLMAHGHRGAWMSRFARTSDTDKEAIS